MQQQRHSVEQIIAKLRRADVEVGKDRQVPEVCKILEITEQTYCRWRQKYAGWRTISSVSPTRKRARRGGLASAAMGAALRRQEFVVEAFTLADPSEIFVASSPWISSGVFCFLRNTSTHCHLRRTD
jgi:hypothetical protein